MTEIRYVLSAHGATLEETFEVPDNLKIQFHTGIGSSISCKPLLQTYVCEDFRGIFTTRIATTPPFRYNPGQPINNIRLNPSGPRDDFVSGIVDCSRRNERGTGNVVVVDLKGRPDGHTRVTTTTESFTMHGSVLGLNDLLRYLMTYHATHHRGDSAILHVLTCRNFPDPVDQWTVNAETGVMVRNRRGGRRKTRRVKGGVSRDVAEALHEAEQKGIEDAKKPFYKTFRTPPGVRINEVARILTRKYPGVSEGQIREKFVEGFTNTRVRNPGAQGSSRRTRRNFVRKNK